MAEPDRPSFGGIDMSVRRNAFGRQVDSFETDLEMSVPPGVNFPRSSFVRRGLNALAPESTFWLKSPMAMLPVGSSRFDRALVCDVLPSGVDPRSTKSISTSWR